MDDPVTGHCGNFSPEMGPLPQKVTPEALSGDEKKLDEETVLSSLHNASSPHIDMTPGINPGPKMTASLQIEPKPIKEKELVPLKENLSSSLNHMDEAAYEDLHAIENNEKKLVENESLVGSNDDPLSYLNAAEANRSAVEKDEIMSPWQEEYFLPPTPDILPLEVGQRLIAIGDIHGNYNHLRKCLTAGGVIRDDEEYWIGGNTICVQVGDVLDRGFEEDKCLLLLTKLARQAKEAGGALIVLWGNHEIFNASGILKYANDTNAFEAKFSPILEQSDPKWRTKYGCSMQARRAAFEPGGLLAEPLLSKLKLAVQVGKTVLTHGGLTKEHLSLHGGISGLNQVAQDWINEKVKVPPPKKPVRNYGGIAGFKKFTQDWIRNMIDEGTSGATRAHLIKQKMPSILQVQDGSSPTMMRDYSDPPNMNPKDPEVSEKVEAALRDLNADRIVVGHTIQNTINSVVDGKVWRIDTGTWRHEALQVVKHGPNCEEEVSILSDLALPPPPSMFYF